MQLKKFFSAVALILFLLVPKFSEAAEFEMVEYSALVKLQWLKAAGIPEADKFFKTIGKNPFFSERNLKDFDRIEKLNSVFQELNYAAAIEYVKANDYKSVMDIACSFSPRPMILAKDNRKVNVCELQAVVVTADELMKKLADKKTQQNVGYEVVLVEDRDAMFETAKKTGSGKVCIIEQGLMVYLPRERETRMFEIIRDVLTERGGCCITSDFVMKDYFKKVAAGLYGEKDSQLLYDETKAMYEKVLDDKLFDETYKSENDAISYLKNLGLKVEKVPLLADASKLNCLKNLTPEQRENISKVAAENYLWVLTPIKNSTK